MLVVENLSKSYPTRSGPLPVLRELNLQLDRGEALAVVGPSGSGKSTFLHILGALDHPTAGRYRLENVDPFTLDERHLAEFRNRKVGFVFQDHHLLPQCSVMENVLIPTLVGNHSADDEVWAGKLLDRVGLAQRLKHRPAELSGGERQRVAIARALVRKPLLLLADEPTGNLDRSTAKLVGELLLELHREQQTILVTVTHSADLAALFPKRLEMNEGRLSEPDA